VRPAIRSSFFLLVCCSLAAWVTRAPAAESGAADPARQVIVRAILSEHATEKRELLGSLAGQADAKIAALLVAWRSDALFVFADKHGGKIPIELSGPHDENDAQTAVRVDTGQPLLDEAGRPVRLVASDLTSVDHDAALRRVMKSVLDLIDLAAPDPATRIRAIRTLGQSQDPERMEPLEKHLARESDPEVRLALREALALIRLKSPHDADRLSALEELKELHPLGSLDFLNRALDEARSDGKTKLAAAARSAIAAVTHHRQMAELGGTIFRSVSLGSILLVVALGLAITFGLMGVINMAHGEMIAIGAYTTYIVQNLFGTGLALSPFGFSISLPGLNTSGWLYQSYFLFSLPLSFLTTALVGIALERCVIRFLYRRPLESLLATWGVSLLLQQLLRLTFGANNVQVGSPTYLSGHWTWNDILLGWNRVFVIGFAGLIVVGVWLVLTRTPLGLLIRAVMQNRTMASCMGVRTQRVNTLTFALGSGLAGLAGAFLSQIGNVGPSLGQTYIVDSFMVVVVGGVGNLVGTVISGLAIGSADQFIQQYAPAVAGGFATVPFAGGFLQNLAQDSAVFGKILVLCCIILFLQWRPAGLFVTRTRSLEG
jgi:urea transport system permease protein